MYPAGAKLEFHGYSSNNVLVLKVTGGASTIVIFINVGTSSNSYLMNPDEIAGGNTIGVKSMGGAPSNKGGDIGAKPWSISVFRTVTKGDN